MSIEDYLLIVAGGLCLCGAIALVRLLCWHGHQPDPLGLGPGIRPHSPIGDEPGGGVAPRNAETGNAR